MGVTHLGTLLFWQVFMDVPCCLLCHTPTQLSSFWTTEVQNHFPLQGSVLLLSACCQQAAARASAPAFCPHLCFLLTTAPDWEALSCCSSILLPPIPSMCFLYPVTQIFSRSWIPPQTTSLPVYLLPPASSWVPCLLITSLSTLCIFFIPFFSCNTFLRKL